MQLIDVKEKAHQLRMQNELEDYDDLRELRKAKADPKNRRGRPFDVVAAEL